MLRNASVLVLVIAMAGMASGQVVWNFTGGSSTDPTDWDDATNWSLTTGSSAHSYPNAQYSSSPAPSPYVLDPPHNAFINNDITAIDITGGQTVYRTVDDGSTKT